jgi:methyl-accepting chemotaxis protein
MSFSRKISIFAGILAIFISVGMGLASIMIASKIVMDATEKSLQWQAETGSRLVCAEILSQLEILQKIANRPATTTMKWEMQKQGLEGEAARLGYLDIGIVDPQGQARYILESGTYDLSDRDYIKQALHGERAISDVLISKVTNKPVVMLAVPMRWAE